MRAVIVSVDYSDYLKITLPYNRHHFKQVLIVTTPEDDKTKKIALKNDCDFYATSCFYDNGANFNKWKALERGLDVFGRKGWLCLMDADVLWPKEIDQEYAVGNLYVPYRRMFLDMSQPIPHEPYWKKYNKHRLENYFSGYSQIFHADDPILGEAPWHETDWKHAGGADTFFSEKWPVQNRIRPNWECLHLGEPGTNWCGRVTPEIGTENVLPESYERSEALRRYMSRRRATGRYDHEKIGQQ